MPKQRFTQELSSDTVKFLLKSIGRHSLLTNEEAIELGWKVQAMQQLKVQPELTQGLSSDQVKCICQAGEQAKRRMIEANLRLVVTLAKQYQKRGLSLPDLIQEGSLGLIRGIEKFDPNKGCRLSTFCWYWIRQGITRAIAEKSRTIRLPIHVNEKLNKYKKTQRSLSQQLGRTPTMLEVAATMKVEIEQLRDLLHATQSVTSLNLRVGPEQDMELQVAKDLLPEESLEQEQQRQDLDRLLEKLTPQYQEVIKLRFGMEDGTKWSFAEIGGRLKLSRERVRQLEQKAIAQLREELGAQSKSVLGSEAAPLPLPTI